MYHLDEDFSKKNGTLVKYACANFAFLPHNFGAVPKQLESSSSPQKQCRQLLQFFINKDMLLL